MKEGCLKLIILLFVIVVLFCPGQLFGFRTAYSPRPGKLFIWGQRDEYNNLTPLPEGDDFVAVSGGKNQAIALRKDGTAVLWGVYKSEAYGDWDNLDANDRYIRIACGRDHWILQKEDGTVVAGGTHEHGCAYEIENDVPTSPNVIDISGGGGYCIAIIDDDHDGEGTLFDWGCAAPLNYPSGDKWTSVSTGNKEGACALGSDGDIEAWGWNNHGQSNLPSGTGYLDVHRGGYRSAWIESDHDVAGTADWMNGCGAMASDPNRHYVSLAVGYAVHSILREDASVDVCGNWGTAPPLSQEEVEARTDILAITAGNGVGLAIIDANNLPVRHEVGDTLQPRLVDPNDLAPSFTSDPNLTATEEQSYTYQITVSEPESQDVSLHLVASIDGMTIDANNLITWTPSNEQAAQNQPVYVRASDGNNVADHAFFISVLNTNDSPVADAGPDVSMLRGWPITLDGSGSTDPDLLNPSGEALEYEWDFDTSDGIQIDSNEVMPTTIYSEPGTYTARLLVRDSNSITSTDTVSVDIFAPRDIYVATDGNDLNSGSISQPLATIAVAVAKLYPEESVVLRAGTYTEAVTIDSPNNITIKNYDGEIAIVDGGLVDPVFTIDAEEIHLEGLGITGAKSYKPAILVNDPNFTAEDCSIYALTLASNDGMELKATATGAVISGCNFGVAADGNSNPDINYIKRYGIKSYATDVTIEDCNLINIPNNYAMYFHPGADRTTIDGCEISGTKNGIYFGEADDCVVTNNLIVDLTSTKGIYMVSGASGQNFTITFNTISDNTSANAINPPQAASADTMGVLKYNIITNNAKGIAYDGLTNSYNLVSGNSGGDYAGNAVPGTGDVSDNPLYQGDYYLDWYSPAVDLADITAATASMDTMTTRLDTAPDFNYADAGYHRPTNFTGTIPPMPYIEANPEAGEAPLIVNFDGSDSYDPDPNASITAWDWNFGDGTTDTGEDVNHVFSDANDYTVTLTVTSSTTSTAAVTKDISIYGVETGGTNLLLILSNPSSPTSNDQSLISWLEGQGYTVALIDDAATQTDIETAAEANDVVVVSSSILGTALQQKANDLITGMVVFDPVSVSDASNGMGFAADGAGKQKDTLTIEDDTHYITGPFSGDVQIFSSGANVTSGKNLASGATWLATVKTLSDWSGLFVFDPNDELISGFGTAAARRVGGLLNADIDNMTTDGKSLILRSIQWAAGGGGGSAENRPPVPIINVATSGEPNEVLTFNGSGTYDPDPGDSVEGWSWDFGDGSTATGEIVTHSYAETETYTATLTAYDTQDANDSTTETIYIQKAPMNLLLIVSSASNPTTNDDNLIAWLQSRGHNITLADDSDSESELADAADGNDAVIVSYSILGTALQQKANSINVGMVVLDSVCVSDGSNGMGFAQDGATKQKNTIVIIDNSHYITSSYSGNVQIFNSSPITTCGRYLAPDANGLATAQDLSDWNAILCIESGGDLISGFGTAPARRAAGLLGGNINNMTEDGKTLLLRAIEWVSE